jgi:hypothetical protein
MDTHITLRRVFKEEGPQLFNDFTAISAQEQDFFGKTLVFQISVSAIDQHCGLYFQSPF